MVRALRAWAINRGRKNSVLNLRYGPRIRLVKGIYLFFSSWAGGIQQIQQSDWFLEPSEFSNTDRYSGRNPPSWSIFVLELAVIVKLILLQNCFVIYRQLFLSLASKNPKHFLYSKLCIKACWRLKNDFKLTRFPFEVCQKFEAVPRE